MALAQDLETKVEPIVRDAAASPSALADEWLQAEDRAVFGIGEAVEASPTIPQLGEDERDDLFARLSTIASALSQQPDRLRQLFEGEVQLAAVMSDESHEVMDTSSGA
jgi:hypothetical protein